MMNMEGVNRIVRDLNSWNEKQVRIEKALGVNMEHSRPFLREKLAFLHALPYRYLSLSSEERLALKVSRQEVNRLNGMLYPNPVFRWFNQLRYYIRHIRKSSARKHSSGKNLLELNKKTRDLGFGNHSRTLAYHLEQKADSFSIPVSRYFQNGDNINYMLNFEKTDDGDYLLQRIKAVLSGASHPGQERSFSSDLNEDFLITPDRLYNLLRGKTLLSNPEQEQSPLVKLDWNDPDLSGQPKLKSYQNVKGGGLESLKNSLPEQFREQVDLRALLTELANGERVSWTQELEGCNNVYFLEADALSGSVVFYDQKHHKIDPSTLLEKPKIDLSKTQLPAKNNTRKKQPRNKIGC